MSSLETCACALYIFVIYITLPLHCDACLCLQLVSFGAGILNGVDPNPDNFVCASILHTSAHQVGCLMRLEPNKQVQVGARPL